MGSEGGGPVRRLEGLSVDELTAELQRLTRDDHPHAAELIHALHVHQYELEMQNRQLRETQQLLEDSRSRYADLYDFAPVGYCTLDAAGVIHEINLTGAAKLEADRAAVVGRSFATAVMLVEPWRFQEHLQQCRREGARVRTELTATLLRSRRRVELLLTSVPEERSGWRAITVFQDVTEQRRAGRGADFLKDASVKLVGTLDLDAQAAIASHHAVPFLADACLVELRHGSGVRRAAFAHYDPRGQAALAELGGLSLHARVDVAVKHVLATGEAKAVTDLALPRYDVSSALIVPIAGHDGALGALVLLTAAATQPDVDTARELGHRVGLAMDNAALYAKVREANRAKDEFFATVSHELRTPLGALLMWSQVLRTAVDNAPLRTRALDAIEESARSQAKLVEDLLDLARTTTGKLSLAFERVAIATFVNQVIESFLPRFVSRKLALEVSIDKAAGQVRADPARLRQILGNLLDNALRFSEAGGTVAVSLARAGGKIAIRVRDQGKGIPAAELARVFEPLHQYGVPAGGQTPGMGLGLAIVKALVEQHAGTVTAHSDGPGRGASFEVLLPALADGVSESLHPAPAAPPRVRHLQGMRILVVDDHEDTREGIAHMLFQHGAKVAAASSVAEALACVAAESPHVVVSDISMPGEDGHSLAQKLRGRTPPIHLVALTARVTAADRQRALAAGFEVHLAKPIEVGRLIDALGSFRPPASP